MSDIEPEDYAEAVAWFNECKARRVRDKERRASLEHIIGKQEEELHQGELRVAELEAENAGYKDGAQRLIESNTRLLKRAEQAEAEREAIAKSLQACGNYTGYTMYVEQRDRADEAEAELRKWKADFRAMETVALDHEAELAALRGRRCPSCYFANGGDQWGTIFCAMGITQSSKDFYCGMWEARAEEGGGDE